jgi:hypothetical protein
MDARLILLAVLFYAGGALAQAFDHGHAAWDALLRKHVVVRDGGKASQLRYTELAGERAALKQYLDGLSAVKAEEFAAWSRPQQMAFLINAYNAFTAEKILTRYPNIRSIWDFGKFFGNPFKDRFFTLFQKPHSLDEIEHETLRPKYKDPRVHYAVNCASVGCPMLREEAYVAERLERQLDEQAVRFLSDRSRNRVASGKLEVSRIFDWFKEDFEPREKYFARHAKTLAEDPAAQRLVAEGKAPLTFLDYDWTLNDAKK